MHRPYCGVGFAMIFHLKFHKEKEQSIMEHEHGTNGWR